MTDSGRAVFLSYASQDAKAAQHLCEALRAADVEVWFDQSELRGGDAWDASIRRQIKSCYLFVAIISANTQSREEGYFRREWKLAVDRTNDMAGDRAFLLPVVIDGTPDSETRVPEGFREVQWTRLPPGANTDAFVEHVRRLIDPGTSSSPSATAHSPAKPAPSTGVSSSTVQSRPAANRSVLPWIVSAVLVLGIGYLLAERFLVSKSAAPAAEAVNDKSVAVLPFADMSEKKDQEYFSDGLAEELIEQLGNTPGLKVIARTSSFSFKGKSDDVATIAAKLKVANILEGSVRRSGDKLRVTTELVRADSAQPVWSETFDRESKDVFAIQDEIATAVVAALKVKLTGAPLAAAGHGTTNPEAYNAYLLGRQLHGQGTEAGYRGAFEAYQKAISLDPRYADAYTGLAMSEYFLGDHTGDHALMAQADKAADKALELDPRLAHGYSTRGYLRSQHFDWAGAESDFKHALALEPTNSRALLSYGGLLYRIGRNKEAVATLRKAAEIDPLSNTIWQNLGAALRDSREYPAAYEAFRHALALQPASPYNKFHLACLQLLDGKAQEALATGQDISDQAFRLTIVAMAQHTLGHAKDSQQALEKLISTSAADSAYQVAEVYAWRGEKEKAFEWLERAYRQSDAGLTNLKADPQLTSLHSDPRFATMLRTLNFPP
ncbi:MAG: TIR domain-containing protein [Steroidobacterales bacterium]